MKALLCLTLLPALALAGCKSSGGDRSASVVTDAKAPPPTAAREDDEDDDGEEEVPLAAVPQVARDAAVAAVPGLVLAEAEKEVEDGVLVYDLEGTANGERVEVEVTAGGKVREVERGDDDDDD